MLPPMVASGPAAGLSPDVAIESERKFLVADEAWRNGVEASLCLCQFYVAAAPDRSVRVRIRDRREAWLTLKFGSNGRHRHEYEYALPLEEAEQMRAFALGTVIDKVRHHVRHRGRLYEVDVFEGALAGLVVAELETPDEVADAELPLWLGREITGESAYYNASLALGGRLPHAPGSPGDPSARDRP